MEKRHGIGEGVKYGMVIDLDKCIGCGACVTACVAENNNTILEDETNKLKSITWLRLYKFDNKKPYPETEIGYLPRPCMQCDSHTPCVSVCPATATDYDPDTGIVSQIYTRCIGCRYCVAACPYHVRYFNWFDAVWPEGTEACLNPDVSPRMRGCVEQCTFCHHRLMAAKNKAAMNGSREVAEMDYQPACVEACPTRAIVFGDLNNSKHRVYELKQSPRAFRLLERLGTQPKVYYTTTHEWIRGMSDNWIDKEKGKEKEKAKAHS
ncbi:MAG: 4Fe-4S dicluster domain-containing protein [Deltaproteobacteria bacterium]|nr:4Fe-4S dicluster domain-containing protein [Deltaproteobacteria bacterium]